jgi:hypothetical protein
MLGIILRTLTLLVIVAVIRLWCRRCSVRGYMTIITTRRLMWLLLLPSVVIIPWVGMKTGLLYMVIRWLSQGLRHMIDNYTSIWAKSNTDLVVRRDWSLRN